MFVLRKEWKREKFGNREIIALLHVCVASGEYGQQRTLLTTKNNYHRRSVFHTACELWMQLLVKDDLVSQILLMTYIIYYIP